MEDGGEWMSQLSLDEFVDRNERGEIEEPGARVSEPRSVNVSKCPCCGGHVFRLHAGAIDLYSWNRGFGALADMDHVYERCRQGLIENLRFLYRMFMDLRRRLNLIAVGKAYDDDLYAFVADGDEKCLEYEGFRVAVLKIESLSNFLRYEYHLQRVDDEIIVEALSPFSPQPGRPIGQNEDNGGGEC